MIWTVYPIAAMADLNGYTKMIEDAGGTADIGTCPVTQERLFSKALQRAGP